MSAVGYDVVAAEVHRKALENLSNEMAITMTRTSGSPIVVEGKDFSACLLDDVPEHLGFAAYVLFHIGTSLVGTQAVIEAARRAGEELRPGDGWIVNDPHTAGAAHQGDIGVIMPTFFEGEHLGWAFSNMHVLDVGGVGVSGFAVGARDVFQEGMRFPPIRIIRNGAIDPEWEHFIAANVRTPDPVLNDIRSMIAANNVAQRKLTEIVRRFGLSEHRRFCEINKDLTERLLRSRIESIPDGVYEAVDWNEFDGHGSDLLLEVRLRLEVDGSDLRFEFGGDPQIDAFVNSGRGAMTGQTLSAVLALLAYGDLPVNGGFLRPIHIDLGDPGSVVNSTVPAPVSNAHAEVGQRAVKLVRDVLTQALALSDDPVLRARLSGQSQDGFPGMLPFTINQHGAPTVIAPFELCVGIGGGGQPGRDGLDTYGLTSTTGAGVPDVETHESGYPLLWLRRRIAPDSAGPGQFRGGLGLETWFAVDSTDAVVGPAFSSCERVPPRGAGGGFPGSTGRYHWLRRTNYEEVLAVGMLPTETSLTGELEQPPSKSPHALLLRRDVAVFIGGGGAGIGDPLLREPLLVAKDVKDGYVSESHAAAAYGVVLAADGTPDLDGTAARRAEIFAERIGQTPARPLTAPASVGVSVVRRDDGTSTCGSCGETLGAPGEDWREHAVVREYGVVERFEQLGMHVRPRSDGPPVRMREHYCGSCAMALTVDIGLADADADAERAKPPLETVA